MAGDTGLNSVSDLAVDLPAPQPLPLDLDGGPNNNGFSLFPLLPAELRLKIWAHSFEPRTVELHSRRSHYADDDRHGGVPKWQSGCTNPAALSVSAECRAAALRHYTVRFPLAAVQPCERAGDSVIDVHRVLYISPAVDTVVVLGDADLRRLAVLFSDCLRRDTAGGQNGQGGLRRLGLSVGSWTHEGAGASLRVYARTVFRDLEELTLFMFAERVPPADWRGGVCSLSACGDTDYYRRFAMGRGRQLRNGESWMKVGKKELRIRDLNFSEGW